jgi:hypothetical protein
VQSSISSKSHWCKLDSHLETEMVKYLLLIIIPSKVSLIVSNANSCEPWKTIWWCFYRNMNDARILRLSTLYNWGTYEDMFLKNTIKTNVMRIVGLEGKN